MKERKQRILLFDIDGTLINPMDEGRICLERALVDVFGLAGPIDEHDMAGKTDWQIILELMRLAGLNDEAIEARRADAFAAYAHHIEIAAPTFNMHLLPGVSDLLNNLSNGSGFILGLVTGNVREAVPHKLRAVGLTPEIFTFGAYGSEHSNRNMLPGLALSRLAHLLNRHIALPSALVIGDTPHDIACARYTGLKVLCVASGTYSQETLAAFKPDYLLPDLSQTARVLEILNHF